MKGIVKLTSALLMLATLTASPLVGADSVEYLAQTEHRGFFSRLFSFNSGSDDEPAPKAKALAAAPVVGTEGGGAQASVAQATASPSAEPTGQAASEPSAEPALAYAEAPSASNFADPVDVYEVLRQADESRGNLKGISWKVEIDALERGHRDSMVYDIKARGFNISGINMAPPKSKGQKLLMLDNNMWFHKPGLSKPIPISMRQKLMGQASYGDVASTNYAEDYDATRLPDETVDGVTCYVFDLKARNSRTTYDRIKYWVDKQRLVGVKADYYTLSGKRFKSSRMDYGSMVMISGHPRPFISKISIYEELMSEDVTTLSMTKPRLAPLPDYIFNLNLFMK